MGLVLPDLDALDPKTKTALEDVLAAIQVWAGKVDGLGKWIDVAHSNGFYSSSAGSWTVGVRDQRVFQYSVLQDLMLLRVHIVDSTTASMGNQLFVQMPDGWRCRDNQYLGQCYWTDGTTYGIGTVLGTLDSGGRKLNIVRDVLASSTNWPNATDSFNLGFNLQIPVMLA